MNMIKQNEHIRPQEIPYLLDSTMIYGSSNGSNKIMQIANKISIKTAFLFRNYFS